MKYFIVIAFCIASACAAPLSSDEIQLIKSSWSEVSGNEVDILANFLEQHPEHQDNFPNLAGKELAELKQSPKFAAISKAIIAELGEVIQLLGDSENVTAVRALIGDLAASNKARGVSKPIFVDFNNSLISYLKSHVEWNDSLEAAWSHALQNTLAAIQASQQQARVLP